MLQFGLLLIRRGFAAAAPAGKAAKGAAKDAAAATGKAKSGGGGSSMGPGVGANGSLPINIFKAGQDPIVDPGTPLPTEIAYLSDRTAAFPPIEVLAQENVMDLSPAHQRRLFKLENRKAIKRHNEMSAKK